MMASVSRPAVGAFPMRREAFSGISMTCEAFAATAICREDVARREDTLEIPPFLVVHIAIKSPVEYL